jgi:dipeptidase
MHATGLLNPSSTTGSMVAKIRKGAPHTVWLTGTPHPCLSVYIPFFFGTSVLEQLVTPDAQPDSSLWWRAERLHRWISKDYQKRKALIETKRQDLQCHFIEKEAALIRNNSSKPELEQFSKACLQEIFHTYSDWMKLIN